MMFFGVSHGLPFFGYAQDGDRPGRKRGAAAGPETRLRSFEASKNHNPNPPTTTNITLKQPSNGHFEMYSLMYFITYGCYSFF